MLRGLAGKTVLITSGPTREAIDPIRFITNGSSGAMGFALAKAARDAQSRVVVVSGPTALPAPRGVELIPVTTAAQMRQQFLRRARKADVVIAAAAVTDWRPLKIHRQKIKRSSQCLNLKLVPNPDLIKEAASRRIPGQFYVGFALETRDRIAHARKKLKEKNLDMIVANGPASLASGTIEAVLIGAAWKRRLQRSSKTIAAKVILREVAKRLEPRKN